MTATALFRQVPGRIPGGRLRNAWRIEWDVREERNADGWDGHGAEYPPGPRGLRYRCHHCGREFCSPSGARKHEQRHRGHIVPRVDWLEDGYWQHVKAQERRAE